MVAVQTVLRPELLPSAACDKITGWSTVLRRCCIEQCRVCNGMSMAR